MPPDDADLRRVRVPRVTSRAAPSDVRLGTHVYNLGLRHPFVAARAVQTLDIVSGGRLEFGIGASWLEEEWVATELDFATRGRRVDEALEVCKRLWTEDEVSHHGEFFYVRRRGVRAEARAAAVAADPRRRGERAPRCDARRALGDGWIGMGHDFESGAAADRAAPQAARRARPRRRRRSRSASAARSSRRDDVARWEELGVTRLVRLAVAALDARRSTACAASRSWSVWSRR